VEYEIFVGSKKTEKTLQDYIIFRQDISSKLDKLKLEPRKSNGAHPLHGRLSGKWACWLGSNIRLIYIIDDNKKRIIIQAVGSHKIYN
jgi:addiction module RelE/StbE family toxin